MGWGSRLYISSISVSGACRDGEGHEPGWIEGGRGETGQVSRNSFHSQPHTLMLPLPEPCSASSSRSPAARLLVSTPPISSHASPA